MRNGNQHHVVQSKWKMGEKRLGLKKVRRNKPTWEKVNESLTYAIMLDWLSYNVIAFEINILYRNACIPYIHQLFTLKVRMFTTGVVIHYIGWVYQFLNPFKYTVLMQKFTFSLRDFLQERNSDVNWPACVTTLIFWQYKSNHNDSSFQINSFQL